MPCCDISRRIILLLIVIFVKGTLIGNSKYFIVKYIEFPTVTIPCLVVILGVVQYFWDDIIIPQGTLIIHQKYFFVRDGKSPSETI